MDSLPINPQLDKKTATIITDHSRYTNNESAIGYTTDAERNAISKLFVNNAQYVGSTHDEYTVSLVIKSKNARLMSALGFLQYNIQYIPNNTTILKLYENYYQGTILFKSQDKTKITGTCHRFAVPKSEWNELVTLFAAAKKNWFNNENLMAVLGTKAKMYFDRNVANKKKKTYRIKGITQSLVLPDIKNINNAIAATSILIDTFPDLKKDLQSMRWQRSKNGETAQFWDGIILNSTIELKEGLHHMVFMGTTLKGTGCAIEVKSLDKRTKTKEADPNMAINNNEISCEFKDNIDLAKTRLPQLFEEKKEAARLKVIELSKTMRIAEEEMFNALLKRIFIKPEELKTSTNVIHLHGIDIITFSEYAQEAEQKLAEYKADDKKDELIEAMHKSNCDWLNRMDETVVELTKINQAAIEQSQRIN